MAEAGPSTVRCILRAVRAGLEQEAQDVQTRMAALREPLREAERELARLRLETSKNLEPLQAEHASLARRLEFCRLSGELAHGASALVLAEEGDDFRAFCAGASLAVALQPARLLASRHGRRESGERGTAGVFWGASVHDRRLEGFDAPYDAHARSRALERLSPDSMTLGTVEYHGDGHMWAHAVVGADVLVVTPARH